MFYGVAMFFKVSFLHQNVGKKYQYQIDTGDIYLVLTWYLIDLPTTTAYMIVDRVLLGFRLLCEQMKPCKN